MIFGLSTGSMTMNQYVKKIELGTNLPIKEHTASMKDWIKMLKHNYEVFDSTAKAVEVKILNMLRYRWEPNGTLHLFDTHANSPCETISS